MPALDTVWYVVVVMHNVQRKAKDKPTKHASARPRGGEGAGGGAPQEGRAGGGTSTTQPTPQNSPWTKANGTIGIDYGHESGSQTVVLPPKDLPDKTLGQHAQQAAERLYAGDMMPNWTPNRGRPKAVVAHQTPGVAFATPEGQAAFAEAVVEHEGIKPACAATGLTPAAVFLYAATHPEFRKVLNSALGANFESQVYKLDELCNKLLDMPPREMNQCANAYGRVFDYRMRIVGKLLPLIYGDQPGTQVNIQNNTGIVCNEATRERLIALNQQLLNVQSKTKELEQ